MINFRIFRFVILAVTLGAGLTLTPVVSAQEQAARYRAILLPYVGQEVLVIDTTSGTSQFQHSDALLLYRLTLNAVQRDYIVVSRNVEGDKRAFAYPLALIRRVTTASGGRPLKPIVIEMY
jgi:hypothetical protein